MRCYVQVLNREIGLLPYFVAHYLQLGATSFPVLTFGDREDLSLVMEVICQAGGEPSPLAAFPAAQFNDKFRWRFVRENHPRDEWGFFPDLDEFAALPPGLIQGGRVPSHEGLGVVVCRWLDRVAEPLPEAPAACPLSPLPDYFQGVSLEDAYPRSCRLRSHLHLYDHVVILSRGGPHGHHPMAHQYKAPIYDAHHFRWSAAAASRLQFHINWRTRWITSRGNSNPLRYSRGMRETLDLLQLHNGVPASITEPIGRVLNIPVYTSG